MESFFQYFYYYKHDATTEVLPHYHNCHEIAYYYEGNGKTVIDNKPYNYSAGRYALYKSGVIHNEIHQSNVAVFCVGFYFDDNSNFDIISGVYQDYDKSVLKILEEIRLEVTSRRPKYNIMANLLTSQLLIAMDRQQNKPITEFDDMYYVKKFINENIKYDISMQNLVDMSGYSYDHFRHMFKEKTGMSPKQYILNKRMEYAKILLADSNMQISQISQESGFINHSQFCILLKKQTGLSPSEYREKYKKA